MRFYFVLSLIFIPLISKAQWQDVGIGTPYTANIAIFTSGDTIYAEGRKIYHSCDDGLTWDTIQNGPPDFQVCVLVKKGSYLYAGTAADGMYFSANNGQNWTQVNNGLRSLWVNDILIKDSLVFIATEAGVYVSANNGQLWNPLNDGLTDTATYALAKIGNRLLVATPTVFYMSDNNGQQWTPTNMPVGLFTGKIVTSGNNIFAATQAGIYLSTDNGLNWIPVNNGLPVTFFSALSSHGNIIFAGTQMILVGGIFVTYDNGNNWTNLGLPDYNIWSLGTTDHSLFAGAEPQALFKMPLASITGTLNEQDKNPVLFPNPAYNNIIITVSGHNATVVISSLQGKLFKTIYLNGNKNDVNISELPKGIYIARIVEGNNCSITKFIKD